MSAQREIAGRVKPRRIGPIGLITRHRLRGASRNLVESVCGEKEVLSRLEVTPNSGKDAAAHPRMGGIIRLAQREQTQNVQDDSKPAIPFVDVGSIREDRIRTEDLLLQSVLQLEKLVSEGGIERRVLLAEVNDCVAPLLE